MNLPNTGFINSNVLINGPLSITNNIVSDTVNSWVRVNGDLTTSKNLTHNFNNSTILVFGTFSIKKFTGNDIKDSLICAKAFAGDWNGYTVSNKLVSMQIDGESLKCIDTRNKEEDNESELTLTPTPPILDREIDVTY